MTQTISPPPDPGGAADSPASPTSPRATGAARRGDDIAEGRLRIVLAANATTSFMCGAAGLVAAEHWSDTLGIDSTTWIRIVAAGLVLFAIDVALVAARAKGRLATAALAVSIGDLAWVAATGVALATVDFTTTGAVLAVVVAVGVLDFALLQLWFRRRVLAGS